VVKKKTEGPLKNFTGCASGPKNPRRGGGGIGPGRMGGSGAIEFCDARVKTMGQRF